MKAFITHVGLNSLMEAINEDVPMIGVPLFADQIHNAGLIRKRRIGVVLDKRNLTAENIRNALHEVLLKDWLVMKLNFLGLINGCEASIKHLWCSQ